MSSFRFIITSVGHLKDVGTYYLHGKLLEGDIKIKKGERVRCQADGFKIFIKSIALVNYQAVEKYNSNEFTIEIDDPGITNLQDLVGKTLE